MASIETPPQVDDERPKQVSRAEERRNFRRPIHSDLREEEFHFLISELRDENSRSRLREAIWISIIVHLVILFVVKESPRLWPSAPVTLASAAQELKNQQLTYLDQRPDNQKAPRPETNKISDKNRMAMSRNPQLKKLLDDLRDNRRMGVPAPSAQQPQQTQQQQSQPGQQASAQPPQQQPQRQSQNSQQTPPQPRPNFNAFKTGSASSAVERAAMAAAAAHGQGNGGEYGSGFASPNTANKGDVEILSDTQGVDFGPYLQRVKLAVQTNWYAIIPEAARSPLLKQGKVGIEFIINRDGSVQGMNLSGMSGDVALDRAAWGGITASNPFPPLPKEFTGPYLALRFRFYYNPKTGEELR